MISGYIRQDTTNQISNGNTVDAVTLDAEFDAIETAFSAVSGHVHDGTSANGAPITKIGPSQNVIAEATRLVGSADNTVDLGSSTVEWKDLWIDGTANIDSLVADTADINGGTIDATVIGATTPAAATVTTLAATSATVGGVAVVTSTGSQTLTNKTIDLASNTLVATSAQLRTAVSDETGTGSLVFATSPSITSPTISGGTITGITDLAVADGGTGASTAADARTNLGLVIGTNVQAYDAELAALASVTSAADTLPYFNGSGTATTTILTSAGRALIDDVDAAAQRATLGLVIGTNVQAQDAELSAIAGLTSAADRLPYFTGSGTAALATFTAAGRALVDDADASAQRTTLGLAIGTDVQAYDGSLQTISGLSLVAGDIIYATGANTFVRLPVGSAFQQLRTNSGANAPEWQDMQPLLGTWTFSVGTTSIPFTGLAGWDEILLIGSGITGAGNLRVRVSNDNGSSYRSTGYNGYLGDHTGNNAFTTSLPIGTGVPDSFRAVLSNMRAAVKTQITADSSTSRKIDAFGRYDTAEICNAIEVGSTSNILSGTIQVYGVRRE